MVICKECLTENKEGARYCQNPECGKRLPISVPPVEPVNPPVLPKELRLTDLVSRDLQEQIAAVLKRNSVADMSAPDAIAALTNHARALAGSASPPIPSELRAHVAAVLQQPNLEEGKSATDLISMLADHAKALKDQVAHHDLTPLHQRIAQVLGRSVRPEESPRSTVENLLQELNRQRDSPVTVVPPGHVKFPAVASKLLHYLPFKSRWVAVLVAPLMIGGGAGIFTPKDQTQLVETKAKLVATAEQLNKTKINLDTQTTQVDTLKDEIRRLQSSLGSDASALNIQVQDLQGQVKDQQQRAVAANAKANQLGAFARYGFLEWRHVGGGPLSFSPTGQPSRGRVTEGIFPSGNCEIVDVVSSNLEQPQSLKGSNCFGPFKIKGKPNDGNDKRVLIVWRQVSGR